MGQPVAVIIGGGALTDRAIDAVEPGTVVVAADSGLDAAVAAGLSPQVLVGDLDSISASGTMWAYAHEVPISRYPADKDATDTALAIDEALKIPGISHLLLAGGAGDRLDHTLGALIALGIPALSALDEVRFVLGEATGFVLHPGRTVTLVEAPGTTFSLLALHGPCAGVDVIGARWPLAGAVLDPGETRGVSNEILEPTHISTATGTLTVILP